MKKDWKEVRKLAGRYLGGGDGECQVVGKAKETTLADDTKRRPLWLEHNYEGRRDDRSGGPYRPL